ncbi:MAG: nucleotidyl transferase AbiEii/AbiGii toxin family protein [Nitrososphaera sp.]|jgi:hypothetical protein
MDRNHIHFSKYLNKTHIDNIKNKFGLSDVQAIEKFIMDYEMMYHLKSEIPCIVKGGMAVPFYTTDRKARRLSVDIDVVSNASSDEIDAALERIGKQIKSFASIERYIPKKPVYKLPMSTFLVSYKSCYSGNADFVKIDIYHDFKENVYPRRIPTGYDLFALEIDYEFNIFGHGSLVGDKLTTLAFDTIGIDPNGHRAIEISKHIYDIGCLVRTTTSEEMQRMTEVFQTISRYEAAIRELADIDGVKVADDIVASMDKLLPLTDKGLVLSNAQSQRFRIFRNQLFSARDYVGLNHKIDILLIRLIASYVRIVTSGQMTISEFADRFANQVAILKALESHSSKKLAESTRREALDLLRKYKNESSLRTLTTEELYLVGCAQENL